MAYLPPGRDEIDTAQLLAAEGVGRMLGQALDRLPVLTEPSAQFVRPTAAGDEQSTPLCGLSDTQLPDSCRAGSSADERTIEVIRREGNDQSRPSLEFWASDRECPAGDIFYSLPPGSKVGIDKSLRYFVSYTTRGETTTAFLNRLDWRAKERGACPRVRVEPLIRLNDKLYPQERMPTQPVAFLASDRTEGRVDIQLTPELLLSLVDVEPRPTSVSEGPIADTGVRTESASVPGCRGLAPGTIGVLMHRGEDWRQSSICDPYKEAAADAPSGTSPSQADEEALETSRMATLRLPSAMEAALRAQKGQWLRGTGANRDGWLLFRSDKETYEVPASIEARHKQLKDLLGWAKTNGTSCVAAR
jgi:hypothetical protein